MSAPTSLDAYDIPFSKVETEMVSWVREALELRHGTAGDPEGTISMVNPSEGTAAITDMLIRVRQRSDRVDGLLSKVTLAKGRYKRAMEQAKFSAEQAYDEATRDNSARRTQEFVTGRERHADASLDSLEERRMAHQAARLVSIAEDSYEVIKQIHWSLDGIRKELRAVIHSLQFESSLER